jgi:acetolactate synthase small subunit
MERKDSVSFPTEMIVHINDKPVTVKKLGLISYSKMSGCIRELLVSVFDLLQAQAETMEQLNLQPGQKNLSVADLVAKLIEKNVEQVIHLLHICVPALDVEYLENEVGLEDALVLIDAILKVNNINKVISEIKKMITSYMGNGTTM